MAIDSVGSSPAIAAQFPPRPPQNTLNSGTDNRAVQNSQEESSSRIAPPPPPPPGDSSGSGAVVAVQPQVNPGIQQLKPGANEDQTASSGFSSSQITTQDRDEASAPNPQSNSNSGSALNYSASGAANAPNSIGPAGRNLSLSV